MNKMQMAHDYFMKHENTEQYRFVSVEELASVAWKYADAMQAEADKREKIELSKKSIETVLNADLSQPMCLEDVSDWQPDWSQAPEWANWWAVDGFSDKKANWYSRQPYLDDDSLIGDEWNVDLEGGNKIYEKAPSFDYQGNWQDSLRKRPQ